MGSHGLGAPSTIWLLVLSALAVIVSGLGAGFANELSGVAVFLSVALIVAFAVAGFFLGLATGNGTTTLGWAIASWVLLAMNVIFFTWSLLDDIL